MSTAEHLAKVNLYITLCLASANAGNVTLGSDGQSMLMSQINRLGTELGFPPVREYQDLGSVFAPALKLIEKLYPPEPEPTPLSRFERLRLDGGESDEP